MHASLPWRISPATLNIFVIRGCLVLFVDSRFTKLLALRIPMLLERGVLGGRAVVQMGARTRVKVECANGHDRQVKITEFCRGISQILQAGGSRSTEGINISSSSVVLIIPRLECTGRVTGRGKATAVIRLSFRGRGQDVI